VPDDRAHLVSNPDLLLLRRAQGPPDTELTRDGSTSLGCLRIGGVALRVRDRERRDQHRGHGSGHQSDLHRAPLSAPACKQNGDGTQQRPLLRGERQSQEDRGPEATPAEAGENRADKQGAGQELLGMTVLDGLEGRRIDQQHNAGRGADERPLAPLGHGPAKGGAEQPDGEQTRKQCQAIEEEVTSVAEVNSDRGVSTARSSPIVPESTMKGVFRHFLRAITTKVFELDRHQLLVTEGSWDYYLEKKKSMAMKASP